MNNLTVLEACKSILDRQTDKGIHKYGATLDTGTLSARELIEHAQEEAADLIQYLEALKRKLDEEV